jgi:hypothetical protein
MSLLADIGTRIDQVGRLYRRASLAPALVRVVILAAASVSLLLAFPPVVFLQLLIFLPALFPRTMMTTVFIGCTVLLWLISSGVNPDTVGVWRVCGLAIALYVVHIGSALAAVLPYDAVLTPGVFGPWILRVVVVAVLTTVVGLFISGLEQVVSGGSGSIAATLGGFVLLVTTAILLTYLGNRRQ